MTDLSTLNHPASIKANVSARPSGRRRLFFFQALAGGGGAALCWTVQHRPPKGPNRVYAALFFAVYGMEAASKVY
jgi:hypothetical protein